MVASWAALRLAAGTSVPLLPDLNARNFALRSAAEREGLLAALAADPEADEQPSS